MVQVQENHAILAVRVGEEVPSPAGPDYRAFESEVLDAAPVAEWPNLFASRRGHAVTLSVRRDDFEASSVEFGGSLVCTARLVSPGHAIVEGPIPVASPESMTAIRAPEIEPIDGQHDNDPEIGAEQ